MALLMWIWTLWVSVAFASSPEPQELRVRKRLDLTSVAGNIQISPDPASSVVRVAPQTEIWSDACVLHYEETASAIVVRLERSDDISGECEMDFEIVLPPQVDLNIDLAAGDVTLGAMTGSTVVRVDDGAVRGTVKGPLDVYVTNGDIDMKSLSEPAEVRVGSGSIALHYAEAMWGSIRAAAGAGQVFIALPVGSRVRPRLATGWGETQNDLKRSPFAPTRVRARVGSGSIVLSE
ncbi:MAG: hypothetical protein AAFV53_38670 [Myxococcota bacterium]